MGEFEVAELRRRFADLTSRIACDPRALLPERPTLWNASVLQRPTVCTGSSNYLSHSLRMALRQHGNLVGIVDDGKVGQLVDGIRVIATGDLGALKRKHPNLLLVNSAMLEAGRAWFDRTAVALNIDCVNTLEYHRLVRAVDGTSLSPEDTGSRLLLLDDPLLFFDNTVQNCDGVLRTESLWSDELSRVTMYHLLLFRLTFDPVYLSRSSMNGYRAPPGPHAYVFDTSIFEFSDREYFVDGGAYRGDTFEHMFSAAPFPRGEVHAFEPDAVNMAYCRAKAMDLCGPDYESRIRLDSRGLWERSGILRFSERSYQDRVGCHFTTEAVDSNNDQGLEVAALDDVLERPPTYIKLEVEGAETWALRGAARTILRHRPKLALGAYHRPLDMLDLARMVTDFDLNYRVLLRHLCPTDWATTVCYAAPAP